MEKNLTYDKASTNGHTFFLYSNDDERLALVAEYFRQGLAKNELCVFVTPEQPHDVIENFRGLGFDVRDAVEDGALRIYEMNQTYLPEGHFAADYMHRNVLNFMTEAKKEGYKGLRTAGEMGWLADHPEAIDDAASYEQGINTLTPDTDFVGLCLYPIKDGLHEVLHNAAHSHPSFIYEGEVQKNLHYKPAVA